MNASDEFVGAIGADRHEGAAAKRKLAAIAGEDIEADGRERQDEERNEDGAQEILAAKRPDLKRVEQRHADEGGGEQNPKRDAILADRKYRHVGGVAGLELAGFAVEQARPLKSVR